jgi:hypothetical protein
VHRLKWLHNRMPVVLPTTLSQAQWLKLPIEVGENLPGFSSLSSAVFLLPPASSVNAAWGDWGECAQQLNPLYTPCADPRLTWWPVSRKMSNMGYDEPDCSTPIHLQSDQDIKSMFARQMHKPSTAAAVSPRGVGGGGTVADGAKEGTWDAPVGSPVEAKRRNAPGSFGSPAAQPTPAKRHAKPSQPSQPSAKRGRCAAADAAEARAKQPSMLAFVDTRASRPAAPHSGGTGGKGKPAAAATAVKRKAETRAKQQTTDDYDF